MWVRVGACLHATMGPTMIDGMCEEPTVGCRKALLMESKKYGQVIVSYLARRGRLTVRLKGNNEVNIEGNLEGGDICLQLRGVIKTTFYEQLGVWNPTIPMAGSMLHGNVRL